VRGLFYGNRQEVSGHQAANRFGWLRASVVGGNDGLLSTSSLSAISFRFPSDAIIL